MKTYNLISLLILFLITSPKVYAYSIYEIGKQYEVDPHILRAMAKVESDFNSRAVGDKGLSHGLYQINRAHHKVSIKQARDIEFATHWVCQYLNKLGFQKNRVRAISRYNGAGIKAVRYARKVLRQAERYRQD